MIIHCVIILKVLYDNNQNHIYSILEIKTKRTKKNSTLFTIILFSHIAFPFKKIKKPCKHKQLNCFWQNSIFQFRNYRLWVFFIFIYIICNNAKKNGKDRKLYILVLVVLQRIAKTYKNQTANDLYKLALRRRSIPTDHLS